MPAPTLNPYESAYLDLVRQILEEGSWQDNRTGVRTLSISGAMLKFDLAQGFPALTTRRLAFKSAVGEMVGFLRGVTSAAGFRELGSKVWDANANDNQAWLANPWREHTDELGPVYGHQWRRWPAYKVLDASGEAAQAQISHSLDSGWQGMGALHRATPQGSERLVVLHKTVDQLRQCVDTIMKDPGSRRILFHGWNCAQLDEMALPPCHLLYQFNVNQARRELSLCVYLRSNDIGLGQPFNSCEAAVLLSLVARLTGLTPRHVTCFIADAHIYETHLEMLHEQLRRSPLLAPRLEINPRIPSFAETGVYAPEWLDRVEPGDFSLANYVHHAPLTAPMAV